MSRNITSAVDAALASDRAAAIVLVEMDFPFGFMRVNNSGVSFPWNGHSWLGLGNLGSIDPISEGMGLQARGTSFRLSGVNPANVAVALGQNYQGRDCRVWYAPLDPTTHAVLINPVLVFLGRMDTMSIEFGATATITVTAESRLATWARPRVRRYNDEDQKIDHPSDNFFNKVTDSVDQEIRWGW